MSTPSRRQGKAFHPFVIETDRKSLRSSPASLTLLVPYSHLSGALDDPVYKVYNIHPALLTAPYFLENFHEYLRDSSQIAVLDQTVVEYFDVYEHWLLTGELLLMGVVGEARDSAPTKQRARERYSKLLYCCSLACVLGDDAFLDALVTELVHTLRRKDSCQSQFIRLLTRERIEKVVADSDVHSGYFKLVAHAYARFATVDQIRVLAFSSYNLYFKSQIMQSMASLRVSQHTDGVEARDFVVGVCHFHTHGFYEACTQRRSSDSSLS